MPALQRTEAVAAVTTAAVLLALAPRPAQAARTAAQSLTGSPVGWSDPTAPVVAVIALVAWALAAWLAAAVLLVLASRLPGLAGRLALGLAARTVPLAVRRCVEVALGASLALTPVVALPAAADSRPGTAAPAGTAAPGRTAGTTDSLDWPTLPVTPSPAPTLPAAPGAARRVVVAPGDTLWALAEQSLQARRGAVPTAAAVAPAWPSWWAANRDVIGPDPDLLRPGTSLRSP